MNVSAKKKAAINVIPYGAGLKIGLQMKRRFWEEDERIYGGLSYTSQPNAMIGYPMWDYFSKGKGVLLGAYVMGAGAFLLASKPPEQRIAEALEYGEKVHPGKYKANYECGVAVAWHRVPWTLGCNGSWTDESRAKHYNDLCAVDNRIVLAGEHCSYLPAWQEGAVLSALDAIGRLHKRVTTA
jgi:monoamine oxidase